MKRLIFRILLTFAMTLAITPSAFADTVSFPCGASSKYSVLMPQGVLTSGTKCKGALVIDGSVKIIDQEAFSGAEMLTSVTIPNSVTSIGKYAFADTQLTSVVIPNSVTVISEGVFANTRLESVHIPDSVISIGKEAFSGTRLIMLTIPNSVTSIGPYAFSNSQLNTVVLSNSITTISEGTFFNTNLAHEKSVTIPNSVTSIGKNAFLQSRLFSVTIPNSVTSIGESAFAQNRLTSLNIPNSVISIGDSAFEGNKELKTISIPDELKTLGLNVLDRNFALSSIFYCGKLTGFPITPICPAERQALIEAKATAELKAKQEAEAKAAAELKAKQEADAKAAPIKKTTITCIKGKLTKTVTAINPKCPTGYKKK